MLSLLPLAAKAASTVALTAQPLSLTKPDCKPPNLTAYAITANIQLELSESPTKLLETESTG